MWDSTVLCKFAAHWSPTRPGVIFLSMLGGVLEVWDLLDRTHEPSLITTPTTSTILCISFSASGQSSSNLQLLALGDTSGVLHIMELPRNLRRPLNNEKKIVNRFLNQEMSRIEDRTSREVRNILATWIILAETKNAWCPNPHILQREHLAGCLPTSRKIM